jgi:putative acyl-CoA dehydrogenase
VICLDVLRALEREPESAEALAQEIALGGDEPAAFARRALAEADEPRARLLVERLALALQASLLVRHAPAEISDAFLASRLRGEGGLAYGTLPAGADLGLITNRHRPIPSSGDA